MKILLFSFTCNKNIKLPFKWNNLLKYYYFKAVFELLYFRKPNIVARRRSGTSSWPRPAPSLDQLLQKSPRWRKTRTCEEKLGSPEEASLKSPSRSWVTSCLCWMSPPSWRHQGWIPHPRVYSWSIWRGESGQRWAFRTQRSSMLTWLQRNADGMQRNVEM